MAPHTGPLTSLYSDFLIDPKKDILHAQAGLHYVGSTGNSFQSASAIIGHLAREAILYNKKEQKVLSAVESRDSLVLEVATTIEFTNGGGALLPGLDDNFVTDQTVHFPMVHIVHFEDSVIKQIRVYWEQGCLLKQLGVIGKTGKNWPIRTGEDQIKLVKASIHAVADGAVEGNGYESQTSTRPSSKGSNHSSRGESLQLFAPREIDEDVIRPAVVPPRAGIRPPTRQLHDIVGQEGNTTPPPVAQTPKAGAGKAPGRTFFVGQEIDEAHSTPDRKVNLNPKKYNHFEFDDAPAKPSETPKQVAPKRTSIYSKPGSSWDFADFTTPDKRSGKPSSRNARTFTWSDDEDAESPVKQQAKKPAARRAVETDTHFEIVDETPRKATNGPARQPYVRQGNETNFTLSDDSPAHGDKPAEISAARQTVVKNMEANWSNTSPLGEPKPVPNASGINIGGDGMGGKKGSSRLWDFEDATPKKANGVNGGGIRIAGNGMGGRKGTEAHWAFQDDEVEEEESPTQDKPEHRGICIAGNGMGGRRNNTELHWGFGDPDEEEEPVPVTKKKENAPIAKRPLRKQSEPTKDFWDF